MSAMEDDTETFSIESFSYKCSITEAQDGSFRAYLEPSNQSFSKITSPKTLSRDAQDFNFPTTLFHLDLSHSDDLFTRHSANKCFSPPSKSVSSSPSPNFPICSDSAIRQSYQSHHRKCLKGCWRSSMRCVRQYLGRLRPSSYCAINGCTGGAQRGKCRVKTEQKQTGRLPTSGAYCCGDRSDYENSIIEAVIYCKQSWEKQVMVD